MSQPRIKCCRCGDDECSMIKRSGGWVCDDCEAWEREADSLDIEGYEQQRRECLAEAQEY